MSYAITEFSDVNGRRGPGLMLENVAALPLSTASSLPGFGSALAGPMLPYPTLSEMGKRAAGQFYAGKLFSPATRRLVRVLRWFG